MEGKYIDGDFGLLRKGNRGLIRGQSKTEGYIEEVYIENGLFRWRLCNGLESLNYWDLTFNKALDMNFLENSKRLSDIETKKIKETSIRFNKEIIIRESTQYKEYYERKIQEEILSIQNWLESCDYDIENLKDMSFNDLSHQNITMIAIEAYFKENGLWEIEKKVAKSLAINPYDEYIKRIKIEMAHLGIKEYRGNVPRGMLVEEKLFNDEKLLRKYIIVRLAFMRVIFGINDLKKILLFRGVEAKHDFTKHNEGALTSWSLDPKVAARFCELTRDCRNRNGCIIKRNIDIDKIFMSFFETRILRELYDEKEFIII